MTELVPSDGLSHCACGASWDPAVQAHRQCPLTKDTKLSMECVALGCQRGVADQLIQTLRAENSQLRAELTRTIDILSTLGVRIESVLGKQS